MIRTTLVLLLGISLGPIGFAQQTGNADARAQGTGTTNSHNNRRNKRKKVTGGTPGTQATSPPAPPAPDTPHDPGNAVRQQLPGNPQAQPANPTTPGGV